jgi:hypothetical protein
MGYRDFGKTMAATHPIEKAGDRGFGEWGSGFPVD